MKQNQSEMTPSRVKIMFIKAHKMNRQKWRVGHKAQMRSDKANELIKRGIAQEYIGEWPPRVTKTKINLKDLK